MGIELACAIARDGRPRSGALWEKVGVDYPGAKAEAAP